MDVIYDLVGSIVVGGMIMVMILGFNTNIMEGAATQTFCTSVQSNLTAVTDMIEYDLKKVGYGITDPADSVRVSYIDSNRIDFRADINNDGILDQVHYQYEPGIASPNNNPNTHILYRRVGMGGRLAMDLGITRFRLSCYDAQGNVLSGNGPAVLSKIHSIRVMISIQSKTSFYVASLDGDQQTYYDRYSGGYWERIIRPKNLK